MIKSGYAARCAEAATPFREGRAFIIWATPLRFEIK